MSQQCDLKIIWGFLISYRLEILAYFTLSIIYMQPEKPTSQQPKLIKVRGIEDISPNQLLSKEKIPFYFQNKLWRKISHDSLNTFSVISEADPGRTKFTKLFAQMKANKDYNPEILGLDIKSSRAIAAFLGLGICDAFGASTEFMAYDKNRDIIKHGFSDIKELIKKNVLDTRSGKIGIWTDDCSMALSMADSLLLNQFSFNPVHTRYMFILWLQHGLNNGGRPYSIGLGGNISISMSQFMEKQTQYAEQGHRFNNGNGSLMRLAPIPICFNNNEEQAMKYSEMASRTTHNGDQAKQCSRLLALILVRLIHRKDQQLWKQCIEKACNDFKTDVKSVKYLALSQQEPEEYYEEQKQKYGHKFKNFNKELGDRNWNWKNPDYTYNQTRARVQPGYVGSYCMDALAMALHTVWNGKSFFEIALKNANIGGDCDTVGAVAGQIAGAIYGIDKEMMRLYSEMVDFSEQRYQVFLKAYKLFFKNK